MESKWQAKLDEAMKAVEEKQQCQSEGMNRLSEHVTTDLATVVEGQKRLEENIKEREAATTAEVHRMTQVVMAMAATRDIERAALVGEATQSIRDRQREFEQLLR